ncbi:WD40 repeat-containing protein [Histoplasma capsulatum var. duboisii H88]|uniref:ASTRA-associated protein 1 n=1 Tax=Ajellomyces capsulatus (strain H88) TaxID=544711 RepID=F0UN21_AJEC8|nr:WD40 repeat-containing protein [Histoplasma capsulatum var. duboisii H88]QSS53663.1 WD domain-containing protein [Histoplasma capsulatum var. duboisii H88]
MTTPSASSNPLSVLRETEQTTGKLPPATPTYILRGHGSPIHALRFYSGNSRLISGDAEGWVVVWNMRTKRAVASWRAHGSAILGVEGVEFSSKQDAKRVGEGGGSERWLFTHGRDHKLRVWRFNFADEEGLGKELPVDESKSAHPLNEPWLFHSISVNALNFCAFALCRIFPDENLTSDELPRSSQISPSTEDTGFPEMGSSNRPHIFFLAVPNALNSGGIDIFHLPSEKRVSTISPDPSINTGMVMALELFRTPQGNLCLLSGYEDGRVMIHRERSPDAVEKGSSDWPSWRWERLYINHSHSQPVLSLTLSPLEKQKDPFFLSSSADAILVKHPIATTSNSAYEPTSESTHSPLKVLNTKHAGQQSLRIRNDAKIFATAGWDGRIRVYSCKSMRELAVLKWHHGGCYAVAFADIASPNKNGENNNAALERDAIIHTGNMKAGADSAVDAHTKTENIAVNLANQPRSLAEIKEQRSRKAQFTHWLAAGSKDGKISLWDIY